jgi:hypothetical protein
LNDFIILAQLKHEIIFITTTTTTKNMSIK